MINTFNSMFTRLVHSRNPVQIVPGKPTSRTASTKTRVLLYPVDNMLTNFQNIRNFVVISVICLLYALEDLYQFNSFIENFRHVRQPGTLSSFL
jgi:hypothetical protein